MFGAAIPIALAVFLLASPAGAALLLYEPFDYPAGTVLDGTPANGQNLSGSYAGNAVPDVFRLVAASPGLGYGNLVGAPGAAGNRLTQTLGTTEGSVSVAVDQDLLVGPGDAIYWSALFTFDDASNGNRLANVVFLDPESGDQVAFGEPPVGIRTISVSATTAATGQLVADAESPGFTNGQTLLLVGRYLNAAEADGDRLELLAYDTADADLLPASFDPSDPGADLALALTGLDIDLAKVGAVAFAIRGDSNNFVDELRIGSSYGAVVPEPATAPLLLVGLSALRAVACARGRRRAAPPRSPRDRRDGARRAP